jgi:hypothetical protein
MYGWEFRVKIEKSFYFFTENDMIEFFAFAADSGGDEDLDNCVLETRQREGVLSEFCARNEAHQQFVSKP